jgi:hypothetical protein
VREREGRVKRREGEGIIRLGRKVARTCKKKLGYRLVHGEWWMSFGG